MRTSPVYREVLYLCSKSCRILCCIKSANGLDTALTLKKPACRKGNNETCVAIIQLVGSNNLNTGQNEVLVGVL